MNNLSVFKMIGMIILAVLAIVIIIKLLSSALKLIIPIAIIGFAAYGVVMFLRKKGVIR